MARTPSGSYTWEITNFSRWEAQRKLYSALFPVGGFQWRIMLFPKGNNVDHLSIFLEVAAASIPSGWGIDTRFRLTLVNQRNRRDSTTKDSEHVFNYRENGWGLKFFKPLMEFRDSRKGYLVNDIVVVEAEVVVRDVVPPVVSQEAPPPLPPPPPPPEVDQVAPPNEVPSAGTNRFDTFFSRLEKFISDAEEISTVNGGPSSNPQMFGLKSEDPCLEEIERAKQSLKECLSDLFKLNMKDRLAAALLTLRQAKAGLSFDQQQAIQSFCANFDDFISDFLTFEQDNSEFELQKLARDQMFSAIKKHYDTHLSIKQSLDDLTKEEEELKKKMEEVKSRKEKQNSNWEELMTESEEAKSKYTSQEKKLGEAEEKKRIAEERMSRSTSAWSSLKEQFL